MAVILKFINSLTLSVALPQLRSQTNCLGGKQHETLAASFPPGLLGEFHLSLSAEEVSMIRQARFVCFSERTG